MLLRGTDSSEATQTSDESQDAGRLFTTSPPDHPSTPRSRTSRWVAHGTAWGRCTHNISKLPQQPLHCRQESTQRLSLNAITFFDSDSYCYTIFQCSFYC